MSGDLNEFLRQAALRREARKRQTGSQSAPPSTSQNIPTPPRKMTAQEDLEVLQPIPVEQRHVTPHIPVGDHLGGNAEKSDRKREAHLREVFGNKPAPLERSQKKKPKPKNNQPSIKQQNPASRTNAESDMVASFESVPVTQSNPASMASSELLAFLRNPDSLKMAFIASEIFGRKFQ